MAASETVHSLCLEDSAIQAAVRRRLGISALPAPYASTRCQCGKQAASVGRARRHRNCAPTATIASSTLPRAASIVRLRGPQRRAPTFKHAAPRER